MSQLSWRYDSVATPPFFASDMSRCLASKVKMLILVAVLAVMILPVLTIGWFSASLSPRGQFRAGLTLAAAGIVLPMALYAYGAVAGSGVDRQPVSAARRIPLSIWSSGTQFIFIAVSAPQGIDLGCALGGPRMPDGQCYANAEFADIDWVVREGERVVAKGNGARDREDEIDPVAWMAAQRMGERGKALRAARGLPPGRSPQGQTIFINAFPAAFGHRYTLELTPHFDPRVQTRVSVDGGPIRGQGHSFLILLGCVCGLAWLLGGAVIAGAGKAVARLLLVKTRYGRLLMLSGLLTLLPFAPYVWGGLVTRYGLWSLVALPIPWLALAIFALFAYRWRGLWFLLGAPIMLPVGLGYLYVALCVPTKSCL